MYNYEFNCIVLRAILGSCLSSIDKLMILWYYGILLPEEEVEYSLSCMLNLEFGNWWIEMNLRIIQSLLLVHPVVKVTAVGQYFV